MDPSLLWWLTAVELPLLGAITGMMWKQRMRNDDEMTRLRDLLEIRHQQLAEVLTVFKLEVAKTYARHRDLRELEVRLVNHLLRIERKIEDWCHTL